MSAILSEFPVQYRARPPSSLDGMDWWFNNVVRRHGESINGILTNLRCVCDCDEVTEYIRQTVSFTVSSWSEMEQTYLNYALNQQRIDWPIAPQSAALDALRQVLEARRPGRRHAWTLTPGYTLGYASAGGQSGVLARLGLDFGIPLDRLRHWALELGLHETYLGAGDYQSLLTGIRASLTLTTPGTGFSFRGGVFGELGGAAAQERIPGASGQWRPDVYGQGGVTLGFTIPALRWGRLSIGADILGGTTFGAGASGATPWFGIGLRFGIEFFGGRNR
jgi:hypothetical protein